MGMNTPPKDKRVTSTGQTRDPGKIPPKSKRITSGQDRDPGRVPPKNKRK